MTETNNYVLRMERISKAFPSVQALDNVDFEVAAGEVVALVGENGAGKSTLMKILAGAYKKDAGRIFLEGKEVEIESPLHAQQLGIATIYQEFNLTRNQTAAANIFMTREPRQKGLLGKLGLVDRRRMEAEAQQILDRIGARISAAARVRDLSVAQQQQVEIAKALAVEARIIIMDEPTAALGESEVENLFRTVLGLKEQGISVIFITHRLEELFRVADRVVVLRDGRRVGEISLKTETAGGTQSASDTQALTDRIISMMVGRTLDDMFHKEAAAIGEPILEVRNLSRKGVVEGVSFTLRRGEILGFAGLVGAGRTETVRLLFGADPRDSGEILLEGKPVDLRSPHDAAQIGLGLVPEDRANQGLVLKLPVQENIVLATLDRHSRARFVDRRATERTASDYVNRLTIRTPHLRQKAMFLSGGNQQKIVLAKWLAAQPKVLILDEPTRGIDVGAKAEVHALMSQLAQSGMGIIMISSDLPEVLGMSDRILVMHEGRVAGILDRAEATQEKVMALASGAQV
ncbi:MAG: sugar ABC transporter ATP-binding protein [Caldilineales bacterium]|nr:sugar ABC transporter ATP-binding protein [Caldilineales bacterium]MDW8318992.1 sugar ABC transporter ATP-binding protein [Anaerolineae bacterium]